MPETRLRSRYPLLYWYLYGASEGDAALKDRYARMRALLQDNASTAPQASLYLSSLLHDSCVLGIREAPGRLSIELDDCSAHCFCDAVAHVHGLTCRKKRPAMPVALTFEGLSSCVLNRLTGNRKLLPVSRKKYMPAIAEYLHDEVTRFDENGIALAIAFWRCPAKSRNCVILEVEAEKLCIQDRFRDAFVKTVGTGHEGLFDAYLSERANGNCVGFRAAVEFLAQRDGRPIRTGDL